MIISAAAAGRKSMICVHVPMINKVIKNYISMDYQDIYLLCH